ncbi:MAG: hypothetical protein IKC31_02910 [Clostridia bacterium]|nr:hypothetical protein [Clostridia bacterium]
MKRIGMVVAMREELMPLLESSGTKIAEEQRALSDTFGASVCEMESAAVVLTCQNHGIPFLIVKAVSDGEGGAKDFAAMVERASRQYLELVYRVLERI